MIASLPMYWRDENAPVWQAFWEVFQSFELGAPELTSPEDLPKNWSSHWLRPDLYLSMTCSLPFRSVLKEKVQYVGTLGFGDERHPGLYRSVAVIRPGTDLTEPLTLAYNSADSQSGWAASQSSADHFRSLRFGDFVETGSHASSLSAVARADADIAFLDEVTWRILQKFDPTAVEVVPIGETETTPALPLITALDRDPAPIRSALARTVAAFEPKDTEVLGGQISFHVLTEAEYFAVPIPSAPLT